MSTFNDMSAEEKLALNYEFDHADTTWARRIEILALVRDGANEAQMGRPCPQCKNYLFYIPCNEGLMEGHVYSPDGLAEVQITGLCEVCFDRVTAEPEDDGYDDDNWKRRAIADDINFMAETMGPETEVRVLTEEEARDLFARKEEEGRE